MPPTPTAPAPTAMVNSTFAPVKAKPDGGFGGGPVNTSPKPPPPEFPVEPGGLLGPGGLPVVLVVVVDEVVELVVEPVEVVVVLLTE